MEQTKTDIYIDTSATKLRHSVIEGDLDINQFNVLLVDGIVLNLLKLKIIGRIIGASHLFTFEIDNKQFHEIFACTDYESYGQELASYGPLASVSANVELALWNKVNYGFRSKLYQFSEAKNWLSELEFQADEISLKSENQKIGLVYNFPKSLDFDITPKTIIVADYNSTKNQLNITTAHSYPNEKHIVKSESVLTFF